MDSPTRLRHDAVTVSEDSLAEQLQGLVRDSTRLLALAALRRRGDALARMFDPRNLDDPYPMYHWIRERGPVLRTPMAHMVVGHHLVDRIARAPSTTTGTAVRYEPFAGTSRVQRWLFSPPDRTGLVDPLGHESMIGMDGPDHARLRRLVSKVFTPGSIAALRPRLTTITEGLFDEVEPGEPFDLMETVANVLPVLAICEVLGIPEADHRRFKEWGTAIAVDLDAGTPAHRQRAGTRALAALQGYLVDLLDARRHDPGDDLVSELVHVEEDGDQLDDRELLATCMLLLLAGFETTVNLVGNGTLALLEHPEQQAWLRADLDRVPHAVEELLRYDAPVQAISRIVGEPLDVEIATDHGIEPGPVPAGTQIALYLGGANRDPAVFDDPDSLDVTRDNARKHLSFASGPHFCLGAALARLEGDVAFRVLLERLGELRPAGTPTRRTSFVLRGLESLPVVGTG